MRNREIFFAVLAFFALLLGGLLIGGSLKAMVDPDCPDDGRERVYCPKKIEIQYRPPNEPVVT